MSNIVVLGGGLVGRVMALDIAREEGFQVTVVDLDEALLKTLSGQGLKTLRGDLSDARVVTEAIAPADVVVGAAPGHMGFNILRWVIEAKKPYADISFMPEDFLALDGLAREHGVTAVVDCGVAPGLTNLLCGRAQHLFDRLDRVEMLVGGLPLRRVWPYEYRIVFSAVDVIEEYTRPARYVEHGQVVVKPALTDIELIDFPRVGTLEAFNTDGLRSLMTTINAPFMKGKTMRYPGHAEKMRMLRETGFLSLDPVNVGGSEVRPYDLTTKLLFDAWRLPEGEHDMTVMQVKTQGLLHGVPVTYTWDLYDEFDRPAGTTSMARTTGFPCAIVTRLLASGALHKPGVLPPERLGGEDNLFNAIVEGLADRGVELKLTAHETAVE